MVRFTSPTPRASKSVGRPFACQTVRRVWGGEPTPRRTMGPGAFGPWRSPEAAPLAPPGAEPGPSKRSFVGALRAPKQTKYNHKMGLARLSRTKP